MTEIIGIAIVPVFQQGKLVVSCLSFPPYPMPMRCFWHDSDEAVLQRVQSVGFVGTGTTQLNSPLLRECMRSASSIRVSFFTIRSRFCFEFRHDIDPHAKKRREESRRERERK